MSARRPRGSVTWLFVLSAILELAGVSLVVTALITGRSVLLGVAIGTLGVLIGIVTVGRHGTRDR